MPGGWDAILLLLKFLTFLLHLCVGCTKMKFHTRTILYKGTVKLFYIDYLILGFRENLSKNTI